MHFAPDPSPLAPAVSHLTPASMPKSLVGNSPWPSSRRTLLESRSTQHLGDVHLVRTVHRPDPNLARPAAGTKTRFVSSSEEPRSSHSHSLGWQECVPVTARDGLGVRWRLGEMGFAMALSRARHHHGGSLVDRPRPASTSASTVLACLGCSCLEAN